MGNLIGSELDHNIKITDSSTRIFSLYNYFWYMLFVAIVGIVGNAMVLIAFYIDHSLMKSTGNMLVANLSIADLSICLLSGPIYLVNALTLQKQYQEIRACFIMGWLQALMFCVSLYSLALIGLTRMMLVSRNKRKYNEWCTPKMGYVWIFLSWIISLALTLIPEKVPSLKPLLGEYGCSVIHGTFLSWGLEGPHILYIKNPFARYHAKFRCCLWEEEMQDLKFSWGTVISLFVMIPSILVASFCYYKIYRIARKSKMRIRANDSVQPSKSVTQLAPHGASENVTTSMNNYALPVANASTTVVVKNNFLNDQKEEIRYVDQDSVKIDKKFSSTKQQPALKKTTIIHIDKTKYNKIHPYDYPSMEKYEKSTAYESTAEFAFTSTTNNVQGNNVSILENVISRRARHRFVREHKTNIFLLVFFVAFTVCWFPWNLIVLLENYVHFPLWFFRLAPVLSLTNSAINPFTYGFLNEKFRSPYSKLSQHLKSILGRHRIQA